MDNSWGKLEVPQINSDFSLCVCLWGVLNKSDKTFFGHRRNLSAEWYSLPSLSFSTRFLNSFLASVYLWIFMDCYCRQFESRIYRVALWTYHPNQEMLLYNCKPFCIIFTVWYCFLCEISFFAWALCQTHQKLATLTNSVWVPLQLSTPHVQRRAAKDIKFWKHFSQNVLVEKILLQN